MGGTRLNSGSDPMDSFAFGMNFARDRRKDRSDMALEKRKMALMEREAASMEREAASNEQRNAAIIAESAYNTSKPHFSPNDIAQAAFTNARTAAGVPSSEAASANALTEYNNALTAQSVFETAKGRDEHAVNIQKLRREQAGKLATDFLYAFSNATSLEDQVRIAAEYDKLGQGIGLPKGKFADIIDPARQEAKRNMMSTFQAFGMLSNGETNLPPELREKEMERIKGGAIKALNVLQYKQLQKGVGDDVQIVDIIPVPGTDGETLDNLTFAVSYTDPKTKMRKTGPITELRSADKGDGVRSYTLASIMDYQSAEALMMDNGIRAQNRLKDLTWKSTVASDKTIASQVDAINKERVKSINDLISYYTTLAGEGGIKNVSEIERILDARISELNIIFDQREDDVRMSKAPHTIPSKPIINMMPPAAQAASAEAGSGLGVPPAASRSAPGTAPPAVYSPRAADSGAPAAAPGANRVSAGIGHGRRPTVVDSQDSPSGRSFDFLRPRRRPPTRPPTRRRPPTRPPTRQQPRSEVSDLLKPRPGAKLPTWMNH